MTNMKTVEEIEKKDIAILEEKSNTLLSNSSSLKIKSQKDLLSANELLKKIGEGKKFVAEKKRLCLGPISEAVKNIRLLFRPIEDAVSESEFKVKSSIMDYKRKIDAETEKKKAEVESKVESGKVSFEKASKQIEKVEQKTEVFNTRKIKEVIIFDESKLPREYLIPDSVKIRKVALAGVKIAGVKVEEKEIPVTR